MTSSDQQKYQDDIVSEAASWVAQIDSQRMTDADRIALREWASRSPRHMMELRQMADMWCDIDDVLHRQIEACAPRFSLGKVFVAGFRLRPALYSAVASVAAAIMVGAFFGSVQSPVQLPVQTEIAGAAQSVAYQTLHGEDEKVVLEDGTIVHLNTNTLLEVEYNAAQRVVRLEHGEALFDVAHEPERPFLVYADQVVARAVGTSFVVRKETRQTSVLVREGIVELKPRTPLRVTRSNTNLPDAQFLKRGEMAQVDTASPDLMDVRVVPLEEAVLASKLAWRDGLIIFEGEPLSEAIEEVSRYTEAKVVISDPALRSLPIGGVFPVGEMDSFLGALEASFDVHAEFVEDEVIYLSKTQ